jgi:hypothetical protein
MIFVGDDWAQEHHDVYLMDEAGRAGLAAAARGTDRHPPAARAGRGSLRGARSDRLAVRSTLRLAFGRPHPAAVIKIEIDGR